MTLYWEAPLYERWIRKGRRDPDVDLFGIVIIGMQGMMLYRQALASKAHTSPVVKTQK